MDEFEESLYLNKMDIIDLKIYTKIDFELNELEKISRLEQYRKQIHSRRIGIRLLLSNFEYNNCALKSKNRFGFNNTSFNKPDVYEKSLDNILLNKIEYIFNEIYSTISHNNTNNQEYIKEELNKIIDRKLGIQTLFDNYSENIDFLKKYKGVS